MSWITIHLDDAVIAALDAQAAEITSKYPSLRVSRDDIARSLIARGLATDSKPATAPAPAALQSAGSRLRELRTAERVSLKRFAEQCGASSAATISAIERDTGAPGFKLALAIEKRTSGAIKVEDFGFDRATARRIPQAEASR